MSTVFPSGIDAFSNPTTLKVDGVDIVKADHVNDLQDSVLATEGFLITPGFTYVWSATNFPDDTPIVSAILALDTAVTTNVDGLADHIGFVLITDPIQHHSNVIEVTPGGNLTSDRVQPALEELQGDIDNIMTGGIVNTVTLDDRYVGKTGDHIMAGSLTIQTDLEVDGSTTLNSTLDVTGLLIALGALNVTGDTTITSGNITVDDQQWIGADESSSLFFDGMDTWLRSRGDLILHLDADDLTDGGPESRNLYIKNGTGTNIVTIDELGNTTTIADILAVNLVATTLTLGALTLDVDGASTNNPIYHIDLDTDANTTGERFILTKNDDPGTLLSSTNFLLEVDENAQLTTGIHRLKTGIQETGFLGLRNFSPAPGNIFYGQGVNFKTVMTNGPSSITLTPIVATNTQSLSVTFSNVYGFMWEVASVASGDLEWYGTYLTVGN